jgi:2-keto-4-pentenoate hydratase/2-oxohepta-3-ene-1,7-dioic acid hydratase in catechol pathway
VKLLAPLTNPRAIFGSGPNYRSHGQENPDWEPADEPQWDFIKLASAITGPFDPIVIPPNDDIIIRRPGGKHRFADFGFAVDYDVGARSVQFYFNQRDLAKNFDTFLPDGPVHKPGDLVRCSATSIGYLENPVVQGTARARACGYLHGPGVATFVNSGSAGPWTELTGLGLAATLPSFQ